MACNLYHMPWDQSLIWKDIYSEIRGYHKVNMKTNSFHSVTPCSLAEKCRHFGKPAASVFRAKGLSDTLVPFCQATWYHTLVNDNCCARAEILTAQWAKIHIFRDIMPCWLVNTYPSTYPWWLEFLKIIVFVTAIYSLHISSKFTNKNISKYY